MKNQLGREKSIIFQISFWERKVRQEALKGRANKKVGSNVLNADEENNNFQIPDVIYIKTEGSKNFYAGLRNEDKNIVNFYTEVVHNRNHRLYCNVPDMCY